MNIKINGDAKMQYSNWEMTRCPHGRIYWIRWQWKDGLTIEDSQPESSRNSCKICKGE